ncbi:MAG: IS200/IS605 family transposase [Oligoflexales bacterium]
MSRFQKLSHVIWHCQYHIVWCPKYRYRVLKGKLADFLNQLIQVEVQKMKGQIVELNVQEDHVHLLLRVPPKISVSQLMGTIKGKSAIQLFQRFPSLRTKRYWGNRFWAQGYCVDTVGLDSEKIRKYVKYQEDK